jgi:hypothetical protein
MTIIDLLTESEAEKRNKSSMRNLKLQKRGIFEPFPRAKNAKVTVTGCAAHIKQTTPVIVEADIDAPLQLQVLQSGSTTSAR